MFHLVKLGHRAPPPPAKIRVEPFLNHMWWDGTGKVPWKKLMVLLEEKKRNVPCLPPASVHFFAYLQQNVSKELPIVTASASYNLPGGLLFHCPTDGHLQGHQWLLMDSSVQSQITVCSCRSQHLTRWPRTTPSSISMGILSVSHCLLLPSLLAPLCL